MPIEIAVTSPMAAIEPTAVPTSEASNITLAKQVKADDKTVAKVLRDLEAASEIPRLEKTVGADGKARKPPGRRVNPKSAPKPDPSRSIKDCLFVEATVDQGLGGFLQIVDAGCCKRRKPRTPQGVPGLRYSRPLGSGTITSGDVDVARPVCASNPTDGATPWPPPPHHSPARFAVARCGSGQAV